MGVVGAITASASCRISSLSLAGSVNVFFPEVKQKSKENQNVEDVNPSLRRRA